MKQKIPTGVGTIIIIIFAVTVGMFVWRVEKDQPFISQSQFATDTRRPVATQMPTVNQRDQSQQNSNQQLQVSQGSNKETKRYINKTFGFEFEFPANLLITSRSNDSNIVISYSDEGHWGYSVNTINNANELSLVQALSQELKKPQYVKKNIITSDIILSNIPAKRFSITDRHDYGNTGAILVDGNYIITIYGDDSNPENKSNFETFLGTFKFSK